jgi:hypothetical protein
MMNVDHGQVVGRGLMKTAVILSLHQVIPVPGWPAGWLHDRRIERFTQMRQNFPNRPRIGDEADQLDIATTLGTRQRNPSPKRASSFT